MKKAFKFIALFTAIISLLTQSAFAQEKTIEWDDGYDIETYYYGGELKLGTNTVSPISKPNIFDTETLYFDYVYYEFEVQKSGYYCVDAVGDLFFTPSISQDITDDVVYGEEEYIFLDEGMLVYLEEGNSFLGVSFFIYELIYPNDIYSGEINIEYIAEEITDMYVEDEYLEDIVFEEHICPEYNDENISGIPVKGKLVFNGGIEKEFDQYLNFEYPEDIVPGKNEITFILPRFKKSFTVDIKTIADFIGKIEIGNPEEAATVKQLFLPDAIYAPDVYVELILTKPDGTKITEEVYGSYDLELKGDKYLTIWCNHYQKDDGNWYLTVEAGNEEYLSIPCEATPASFTENYILYTNYVTESMLNIFVDFSWYMFDAVNVLSGLSIKERAESFSDAFISVGENCSEIYNLNKLFLDYIL